MNESNGSMELYLREHTEEIINKWLSKIYENENTYTSFVYSPRYKDELRADSEQTADLIISYFAGKKAFFEKLDKWLDNMYARRRKMKYHYLKLLPPLINYAVNLFLLLVIFVFIMMKCLNVISHQVCPWLITGLTG